VRVDESNKLKKWFAVLAVALAATAAFMAWWQGGRGTIYIFKGVSGPLGASTVAVAQPARWQDFDHGDPGRLALLLTDPDSAWLGLVHGLQSIGVPLRITRDYQEALRHRVVLVYPTISGRVLSAQALKALARFPAGGGTLIGVNVEGGGLNEVFGFAVAQPARTRRKLVLDPAQPLAGDLADPRERVIRFSDPASGANAAGSFGYTDVTAPLARFEDGTAAITARTVAGGHAYAFGIDLGFVLLTGYNNREQGLARSYVNGYEPALDVLLRLLRSMYREGEPESVTLETVPQGKSLATLLTHDVDFGASLANATEYASYEVAAGLPATYFIQTKYMRDWNDDAFYNAAGLVPLQRLRALGVEVASHTVAHSRAFNSMPLGTGTESYPAYRPFVRNQQSTDRASVLGELRVSRFLLEQFLPDYRVVSFRAGHLREPYSLPQALAATGYLYDSSATANNSLTHLPFRLTYGRETTAQSSIFEFPVTIEDEEQPPLAERLPQALALAGQLGRYGGLFVVLIHTETVGPKLEFERRLVEALRQRAWFGTMRQFGDFWAARDQVAVDVARQGAQLLVTLAAPVRVAGLTLRLPKGYRVASVQPRELGFMEDSGRVVLDSLSGDAKLVLVPGAAAH
jgi:hypothetical protein